MIIASIGSIIPPLTQNKKAMTEANSNLFIFESSINTLIHACSYSESIFRLRHD